MTMAGPGAIPNFPDSKTAATEPLPPIAPPPQNKAEVRSVSGETVTEGVMSRLTVKISDAS
jgi:hypothetical protein